MIGKAVGFYWTLPAPRVGFIRLPRNADDAAKVSKTVRYQRDLTRRYANEHRFHLVHEEAFLEVEPDRGSPAIVVALEQIKKLCEQQAACLLYVNFADVHLWRAHRRLHEWLQASVKSLGIAPDLIFVDGQLFDPIAHFRKWRSADDSWSLGKGERIDRALARVVELRSNQRVSLAKTAQTLNTEGLPSPTGKPWTEDSLRKQLKVRENFW